MKSPIKAFFDGDNIINLHEGLEFVSLSDNMLRAPFRSYVINKVKAPLQKAIEAGKTLSEIAGAVKTAARLIPKITRRNLSSPNSRLLRDISEYVDEHHLNKSKSVMLNNATKIGIAEIETDPYYEWFFNYYVTQIAIAMIEGKWKIRSFKFPESAKGCWSGEDIPNIQEVLEGRNNE